MFLRAGVPGELVTVLGPGTRSDGEAAAGGPGARGGEPAAARGDGESAAGAAPVTGKPAADDWSADLDARCDRVIDLPRPNRLGTLLVLEGAPREQVVEAAL